MILGFEPFEHKNKEKTTVWERPCRPNKFSVQTQESRCIYQVMEITTGGKIKEYILGDEVLLSLSRKYDYG